MKFRFVIHYNLVREISVKLIKKMPPKKATLAEFWTIWLWQKMLGCVCILICLNTTCKPHNETVQTVILDNPTAFSNEFK